MRISRGAAPIVQDHPHCAVRTGGRATRPLLTLLLSVSCAALAATASGPAWATQTRAEEQRAVERAGDAFGLRIGGEQIGLYNESQVRGFNLQDAGNFRIDGLYFARSAPLVDAVLGGVVTRVGVNALSSDFAAPSGVVDYRLRSPFEAPAVHMEMARREYGTIVYSLAVAEASENGRVAGLLGGQVSRGQSSTGLTPDYDRLGGVLEWRPSSGGRILAFASLNRFDLEGFYGVSPTTDTLPPTMVHPGRYVPSWSDHDGNDRVAGGLATVPLSDTIEAAAAVVYSHLDLQAADFTVLQIDGSGHGRARTISNPPRDNVTWSSVGRLAWRVGRGQRLYGEVRGRRTEQRFGPAVSVDLGPFDLAQGLGEAGEPNMPSVPRTLDLINQTSLGIGYEVERGRWRFKAGAQAALHERRLERPGQAVEITRDTHALYDLSIIYGLSPRLTAFATATRGLEESGVAPANAANASEVLPAVLANQQELGIETRLSDHLTLLASLYSIEKPAAGFDASNAYRLVGELRHRGAELSLTGRLTDELRVVAGAAWLEARRAGAPVEAGDWSSEAVGLPANQAMLGVTWSPKRIEGFSLDAQINHGGDRLASSSGDLRTPAMTTVDLGFRHAFQAAGRDLVLRGRISNLTDEDGWVATRNELLERTGRRGGRISLTANF